MRDQILTDPWEARDVPGRADRCLIMLQVGLDGFGSAARRVLSQVKENCGPAPVPQYWPTRWLPPGDNRSKPTSKTRRLAAECSPMLEPPLQLGPQSRAARSRRP